MFRRHSFSEHVEAQHELVAQPVDWTRKKTGGGWGWPGNGRRRRYSTFPFSHAAFLAIVAGRDRGALLWAAAARSALPMADDLTFGPKMRVLGELQQRFVLAMLADPFASAASWARAAGYSDHMDRCKVTACELMRNPRIEAAIAEVSRATMNTLGPVLATAGLIRIARDTGHPKHFQALLALANRTGLHETTEHVVSVNHTDLTGDAMLARIRAAGRAAGMSDDEVGRLIGVNAAPVMIEGEVVDAQQD